MIFIWIILILLLVFLIWILVAPVRLNIDSKKNEYLIKWLGLGKLALIPAEEEWFFSLKIGFWKKKILFSSLIQNFTKKEKKKIEPKKKHKKSKKTSLFSSIKRMRRVLQSFEIKVCKINLDTDDYYWNALLIPAFQVVNRGDQHRIAINFRSKNDIQLIVENRLIKVLYSIFK